MTDSLPLETWLRKPGSLRGLSVFTLDGAIRVGLWEAGKVVGAGQGATLFAAVDDALNDIMRRQGNEPR
jgi:hypothetical protein